MSEFTTNYGFELPNFNASGWHDAMYKNFRSIDTMIKLGTGLPVVKGAWENGSVYTENDRVLDAADGTLWQVEVAHTSAVTGTFAEDRADNPTYWIPIGNGWVARGEWENGEGYFPGDTAYDESELLYGVCATAHTSNALGSMRDDIANWVILMDGEAITTSVNASLLAFQTTLTTAYQAADTTLQTNLQGQINGKAATAHTHTIADVTGLQTALDARALLADIKWISKAIGEYYVADTGEVGVDIPPKDNPNYRYVELTAGLTLTGSYNEGIIVGESVSGSAPLVSATGVVSLVGSPMNGQTIRMLNTERRMLRAGSRGTLQDDAAQRIEGTVGSVVTGQNAVVVDGVLAQQNPGSSANLDVGGGQRYYQTISIDSSRTNRTDTENRMKNIGVRIFRRIK